MTTSASREQVDAEPASRCPPEIRKRIERKLFGRTPTEAWVETRQLDPTTRVVYASVCSLINGASARIKTSEVAYLSNLGERQTRRHLQVLEGRGRGFFSGPAAWGAVPLRAGARLRGSKGRGPWPRATEQAWTSRSAEGFLLHYPISVSAAVP